jgi:hypothetical protein
LQSGPGFNVAVIPPVLARAQEMWQALPIGAMGIGKFCGKFAANFNKS